MTKRAILLTSQDGEWEALFIDGKLIDQGEHLGEGDPVSYWIEMTNKYKITVDQFEQHVMNDVDNFDCHSNGGIIYENLIELKGIYGKQTFINEDNETVCQPCSVAQTQCCIEMLYSRPALDSDICVNCHKPVMEVS